jgi:hypothetical protein
MRPGHLKEIVVCNDDDFDHFIDSVALTHKEMAEGLRRDWSKRIYPFGVTEKYAKLAVSNMYEIMGKGEITGSVSAVVAANCLSDLKLIAPLAEVVPIAPVFGITATEQSSLAA